MWGGKRKGAGRPQKSGKYGEITKAIRIPISAVEEVEKMCENNFFRIPLYQTTVSAGFPSPAENDIEQTLNLNELLLPHPVSSFFLRVSGHSMIKAGIHNNDILIVDRSLPAVHGKIVIAVVDGELTVKRLYKQNNKIRLLAENDAYPHIEISQETELHIWGVVTSVIHYV